LEAVAYSDGEWGQDYVPFGLPLDVSATPPTTQELVFRLHLEPTDSQSLGEQVNYYITRTLLIEDRLPYLSLAAGEFARGALARDIEITIGNPSESSIKLDFDDALTPDLTLKLLDFDGNILAQEKVTATSDRTISGEGSVILQALTFSVPESAPAAVILQAELNYYTVPETGQDFDLSSHPVATRLAVSTTTLSYNAAITGFTLADHDFDQSATDVKTTGATPLLIKGRALQRDGVTPSAASAIVFGIENGDYKRTYNLVTDSAGEFSYSFLPVGSEPGGTYTVWAKHPDLTRIPDSADEIGQFFYQRITASPSYFTVRIPRNYDQTTPIELTWPDGLMLTNLKVEPVNFEGTVLDTAAQTTLGIAVTPGTDIADPQSTAKLSNGLWSYTLQPAIKGIVDATAGDEASILYRVTAQIDGAAAQVIAEVPAYCFFTEVFGQLKGPSQLIQLGVLRDETLTPVTIQNDSATLSFKNTGLIPLTGLSFDLVQPLVGGGYGPAPDWATLSAPVIDSLAVGDSFSLQFETRFTEVTGLSDTYPIEVLVRSNEAPLARAEIETTVTTEAGSSCEFHIVNIFFGYDSTTITGDTTGFEAPSEYANGIVGATVTLQRDDVATDTWAPPAILSAKTDSTAKVTFGDGDEVLEPGRYQVTIKAPKHETYRGSIWIKPGVAHYEQIPLNYGAVTVEWEVNEITIEDRYEVTIETTFETKVPAPVLLITPAATALPAMCPGDVFEVELLVENQGILAAQDFESPIPESDEYLRVEPITILPDTFDVPAQQSIRVAYRYICLKALPNSTCDAATNPTDTSADPSTDPSADSLDQPASYSNCTTSSWTVPCPWNPALDVNGSSSHCVYRLASVSSSGSSSSGSGGDSVSFSGGGSSSSSSNWISSVSSTTDPEVCAPGNPDEPELCVVPKVTSVKETCMPCGISSNTVKVNSYVELWGLQYYDFYNDIQVPAPGGWLNTTRTYTDGAWRIDSTNYLKPASPTAAGLKRVDMLGRLFTQTTAGGSTYTSESYILEANEGATWHDSELTLTQPDGQWATYRGTVDDGALLLESGFKANTQLIYEYDWDSYPATAVADLRMLAVYSGLETEDGAPLPLLSYTYAPTDFVKAGASYPLLTSIEAVQLGVSVEYDYNSQGLLEVVRKPGGTRSEYVYDDDDNLQAKAEYDSHTGGNILSSATIDYHPTLKTAADAVISDFMIGASAGPPKRVAAVTSGAGITKTFSGAYNEQSGGYYSKVSYANGRVQETWLDDTDTLIQRSINGQAVYNRARVGRVERITTRGNSVTVNEYDEFEHLIRETDPSGNTRSWTYLGELDRMASYTDFLGTKTSYTYDDDLSDNNDASRYEPTIKAVPYAATRSIRIDEVSKDGSLTRSSYEYYDTLDRLVMTLDPRGHATAYTFKDETTLQLAAQRLDITEDALRYTQTYDDYGHLVTRTDAQGNTTTYDYDLTGTLRSMTDALGQITEYTYDGDDLIQIEVGKTAALPGRITRYTYDADGHRTAEIRVDAEGTEYTYMSYAYDAEGQLVSTTNADGLVITHAYDLYGNRTQSQQPIPAARVDSITATHVTTTQEWDVHGDLLQATTPAGLTTANTYDKQGRLLTATESPELTDERGISFRYDANGNIIETTYHLSDGSTGTTYSVYDGFGRLTSKFGYGVYTESYTYDLNDNIKTVINARGLVTEYSYDDFDRIYQIEQDSTLVTTQHYDANGNLTESINAEGEHQHFAYDALNRQIHQSIPLKVDTSIAAAWWTDFGNVALSNTYNRFGEIETTREAHGQLTTSTYDDFGRLATLTPATGATVEYTYTPADLVQRIRFPVVSTSGQALASEIHYTYDSANPSVLVNETTRSGQTVTYAYDAALRRVQVALPTGAVTRLTFDNFGRLASRDEYESQADFDAAILYRSTSYTAYDDFDRLLELTLPGGEGTQHSEFDDKGNLIMCYGFEADGTTQGGNTTPTIYSYDATGNLETLTTYQGGVDSANSTPSVTTWEYDLRGRLERKIYADTTDVDYTYYDNNRLKTRTNAREQLTTYTYDAWGNVDLIDYADAGETDIDFSYIKGRRQSMADANGTTSWTYHPDTGLPATETRTPLVGDATTVGWTYDNEGRRVRMTVDGLPSALQSDTWQTIYNYDRYGRLELLQDGRAHSSLPFTYGYASGTGLLEQIDSPWRTTGAPAESYLRQTRGHDNFGRLTDIATLNSTDTVSQSVTGISYDPLDRRIDLSLLGGILYASQQSRAYDYDNYGQLKEEQTDAVITQAYEYDSIGNRLNWWQGDPDSVIPTEYTPDAVNQYSAISANSTVNNPIYDDDGNLTTDPNWSYTWDTENRLISMQPVGTPSEGDHKLTFTYDGLGRRVSKEVHTWDESSSLWSQTSSLSYLYDGWNLIAEVVEKDLQTSPFTLLTSYTWGLDLSGTLQGAGGVGGLLAVTKSDGSNDEAYMPAYDFNGNVTGYFDTATETLVAEYEYSPFGELVRSAGSKKDEFNFRFSSKYLDAETDLYYYGYRYYDSKTGRWLTRDPLTESGGLNLYAFGPNSPINGYDADGRVFNLVAGAIIGGGLDIAVQMLVQGKSFSEISVSSVLVSAAFGATGAGLGANLGKLGIGGLGRLASEGALGAGLATAEQLVRNLLDDCAEWDDDLLFSALFGAFLGTSADVFGNGLGKRLSKYFDSPNATNKVTDFADTGVLGGKLYPEKKLGQLVEYLNKRGGDVFEVSGNARFTARADGSFSFGLPANPTALQIKHELSHFLDFKKLGFEGYRDAGRLFREESVLNRLQGNRIWDSLTDAEKTFSIDYPASLK
jgi:RHS repeat-associated protein